MTPETCCTRGCRRAGAHRCTRLVHPQGDLARRTPPLIASCPRGFEPRLPDPEGPSNSRKSSKLVIKQCELVSPAAGVQRVGCEKVAQVCSHACTCSSCGGECPMTLGRMWVRSATAESVRHTRSLLVADLTTLAVKRCDRVLRSLPRPTAGAYVRAWQRGRLVTSPHQAASANLTAKAPGNSRQQQNLVPGRGSASPRSRLSPWQRPVYRP